MSSCFIYQKPTLALMVLHPAPLQPLQTHPPPQISMKPIATRLSAYTEFDSNSDSHYSDCLDPLNLADPPPTTENVFMRHLFDAQKSLETLSNIRGHGTKVKYMGATLNGSVHHGQNSYTSRRRGLLINRLRKQRRRLFMTRRSA